MTMIDTPYTITHEATQTAGLVCYWRLSGQTPLDKLKQAWTAHNLDSKLLPKPPGDAVALGRAVNMEADRHTLVRPIGHRAGWGVVQETVNEQGAVLSYHTLLTVLFENGVPVFARDQAPPPVYEASVNRIRANYDQQRGEVNSTDVSGWLVKLVHDCGAVPLRDTGGIYFVPRPAVPRWRRAVQAITAVSAHRIFQIPTMKNSEAIDAITDAVTQEAERVTREMAAELQVPGHLGGKALENRKKACEELLAKVNTYDNLLGVQMKCRERIESLQAMIVTAALVADEAA